MAEVARGGGCLLEDTRDPEALYRGLEKLATDRRFLEELGSQAASRHIRTWTEYAKELAEALELAERSEPLPELEPAPLSRFRNLPRRPLLSLCVSTYNRAEWLEKSMENLRRLVPRIPDELEILVCDNASTDRSAEVVKPHLGWAGFRWVQNPVNVGLLGNLRITANQSRGRFVWIMGDDDFPLPGAIESILEQLRKRPSIDLLYLNYAVTHAADPKKIWNLDAFLSAAIPASPPRDSVEGRVVDLAPLTENFFSAIYAIVFRRDHAIRAYSQDCSGPPFSSMRSCIPTTSYCLKEIHGRSALWLGAPAIVANMNVSWRPYLALWLLERLPEAHDLAVEQGAGADAVDFWRARNLPVAMYYLERLLEQDGDSAASCVCLERFHERHRHLDEFRSRERQFAKLWHRAHERGWVTRALPPGVERCDG